MSFLSQVTMDPHIHLMLLYSPQVQENKQIILERVHFLAQTRRFDDLLKESAKINDMKFPTLEAKIKDAKAKSDEQKQALNFSTINEVLAKLQADAAKDDGTNNNIDDGQSAVYRLAKLLYDEGNYQKSYEIIKKLQSQDLGDHLYIRTTWARLYCEIILRNPKAKKTADRLKKKIQQIDQIQKQQKIAKQGNKKHSMATQQSIYSRKQQFLNLLCFAYFIQPQEQDFQKFVDITTSQQYYGIVQLTSPHIFRYICVCLVLNKTLHKNRSFDLYMLIQVIRRKVIKHTDPLINFFQTLHIQFDFEQSLLKIEQLRQSIAHDILLAPLIKQIIENCYFLYYKVYCRVYERVSIQQIARSIKKNNQQAELWILGFIRSLDIEAKIDSVDGVVISSRGEQSLNEKYIDLIPKISGVINGLSPSSG